MPHDKPMEQAMEQHLREAYRDLATQPVPGHLEGKVRQAIESLGHAQEVSPGPEESLPAPCLGEPEQASAEALGHAQPAARQSWLVWAPALALACALLVPLILDPPGGSWLRPKPGTVPPAPSLRRPARKGPSLPRPPRRPGKALAPHVAKSGLIVEMYHARKTARGFVFRHKTRQGTRLAPGDLVQFTYQGVAKPVHLMILSINQRGVVSPYFPLDKSHSVPLKEQGKLPTNGSLVLDRDLGAERIFVLTSARRFSLERARRSLAKAFAKSGRKLVNMELESELFRATSYLIYKAKRSKHTP